MSSLAAPDMIETGRARRVFVPLLPALTTTRLERAMADTYLRLKMPPDKSIDDIEWRPFPENKSYLVSEYGHVIGLKGKVLSAAHDGGGYIVYSIKIDGIQKCIRAHRVVARTFLGPSPDKKVDVAHWDGDKTNNHYSNLRYATRKQNVADSIRLGAHNGGPGRHPLTKLNEEAVREIRRLKREGGYNRTLLAEKYGVHWVKISAIANGRSWAWVE